MKIKLEQLSRELQQGITPMYFLTGDVPLLLSEARDKICRAAKKNGYSEINKISVLPGFDWEQLLMHANTLSLFSDKTILDCQIPGSSFPEAAKKALLTYANNPPQDKILILRTAKLTTQQMKAKWFTAITKEATIVQVWPLDAQQFQQWLTQSLQKAGLTLDREGLSLLCTATEGNLLAAKQEIAKLSLQFDKGNLTIKDISTSIADSARFNVFVLTESVLQGDIPRSLRILNNLREESTEPHLILWALCQEVRQLIHAGNGPLQGRNLWAKRQNLLKTALQRHSLNSLQKLLQLASETDKTIKGASIGNAWHKLENFTLKLAGRG